MLNYHRERFRKLTFRALALRQHLSTRLIKPNFCLNRGKAIPLGLCEDTKTYRIIVCLRDIFDGKYTVRNDLHQEKHFKKNISILLC